MRMEGSLAYFTRALPPVMAVAAVGYGLNALIFIAMARWLEPANFGNLKVAASAMLIVSLAVGLGGSRAAGRFLPERLAGSPRAAAYLHFFGRTIVILSLLAAAGIWSLTLAYYDTLPDDIHGHHPVCFVVLLVPVWAGLDLLSQTFMATRRPVLAALPARFVFPVLGLTMIYAAHLSDCYLSDVMFVILLSGAGLTTLAVFAAYLAVLERAPLETPPDAEPGAATGPRAWLLLSLPMMGTGLVVALVAEAPLFALVFAEDKADVGLYAAAITLCQAFLIIVTCQRQIYGPALADALAQGRRSATRLQAHAQRQALMMAAPLLAILILADGPLLDLFGDGFNRAREAVWIVAAALALQAVTALCPRWLDYGGHARLVLATELVAAAVMVAASLAAAQQFGLLGAASVFAAVVVGRSVFLAVMAYRKLGVPMVALVPERI